MTAEYKNPDPAQCKARVIPNDQWGSFHPYQCNRKPWRDGWCKQHHPETEAKRYEDTVRRDKEKREQRLNMRRTVKIDALLNMPPGQAVEITTVEDMDQKLRCAVVWAWNSPHGAPRKSYFDADTGEYISEAK